MVWKGECDDQVTKYPTVGMQYEVSVTAGANQAIAMLIITLVDPSDKVIMFKPYYFNALMAVSHSSQSSILPLLPSFLTTLLSKSAQPLWPARFQLVAVPECPSLSRPSLRQPAELIIHDGQQLGDCHKLSINFTLSSLAPAS